MGYLIVFTFARTHFVFAQADDDKPSGKDAKSVWIDMDKESEDSAEDAPNDENQGREPADSGEDKSDNGDEGAGTQDASDDHDSAE